MTSLSNHRSHCLSRSAFGPSGLGHWETAMDRVLLLDTETTGTDDGALCIEVAAIVFSIKHVAAVRSFSSLLRAGANPARDVNRIPEAMLPDAPLPELVWPAITRMALESDAILCYGADFDRRFVPAHVTIGKPWICAMDDLQWPRATKPRMSLVALALAHDLGVSHAHRAMVDCDLLARLLTRVCEGGVSLETFLARGLRPKARFIVAERGYDPARNELAKAAGFAWDGPSKTWGRTMAIADTQALPFAVVEAP